MSILFDKGSYGDPAGQVFYHNGKVYRGLNSEGCKRFEYIEKNKILQDSIKNKYLIDTKVISNPDINIKNNNFEKVLEHSIKRGCEFIWKDII